MKNIFSILSVIAFLTFHHSPIFAAKKWSKKSTPEKETHLLAPFSIVGPKGWHVIDDPEQLPSRVKIVYVGSGKGGFIPSLNLAVENTDLDSSQYYLLAKNYHDSQTDSHCSHLGTMQTKSGKAELLQIDRKTSFGEVRFLQAILVKDKTAYVITATALLEEYGKFYSTFFNAMQSFVLNNTGSLGVNGSVANK